MLVSSSPKRPVFSRFDGYFATFPGMLKRQGAANTFGAEEKMPGGMILLMMIGVLGEYLWRVLAQTRNTMPYVVECEYGFEADVNSEKEVKG